MHKGILAGRLLEARKALVKLAETAVSEHGLDSTLLDNLRAASAEKRPEVRVMRELEAIVPVIEMLLKTAVAVVEEAQGYLSQEEILAIPGLSKSSIKAIEAYFASKE